MDERAAKINEVIKKSGYSYAELSSITGISKSSLQRYATGQTKNIPIDNIIKITKALNISSAAILTEDELLGDLMNYLKENNAIIVRETDDNGNENVMSYNEWSERQSKVETLMKCFSKLNSIGQNKAVEYLTDLSEQKKYTEK